MTTKDVPQRFPSGTVEVVYSNSKVVSVAMQIMFILLGGYFFWVMLHETSLLAKADNVIILAFCLWRIDRQGDPVCYVCKKGIVVQRQFVSIPEFLNPSSTVIVTSSSCLIKIYLKYPTTGVKYN